MNKDLADLAEKLEKPAEKPESAEPLKATDSLGNIVTLGQKPRRP
jgi:hypothetical protein